jgi:ankyrin repeat protein
MDSLENKATWNAVLDALEHLPQRLDDTYGEALERIRSQNEEDKELATHILMWITCAMAPLSVSELQHALAVKPGTKELDSGDLPFEEILVEVCAGLVTVDQESSVIRLVHYTTQDYMKRKQQDWFPIAQVQIATACLTYLSFDVFGKGPCPDDEGLETRLKCNPLLYYAAQHWGDHAREDVRGTTESLVLDFLDNTPQLISYSQVTSISDFRYGDYSQRYTKSLCGLHVTASCGLSQLSGTLLAKGAEINEKNSDGETALYRAAGGGHKDVVNLLLAERANINAQGGKYGNALQAASDRGHKEIVQLLLEHGANINAQEGSYGNALQAASTEGHKETIQLLLEHGANINAQGEYCGNALQTASARGHKEIVQLLLEHGANINAQEGSYGNALQAVSAGGHKEIVQLLLEHGANINAQGGLYGNALQAASAEGHKEIVQLLVERGAVLNKGGDS